MACTTFQMFSLETWKCWDKTGKLEVLKKVRQHVKDKSVSIFSWNIKECDQGVSKMLYEVVSAVVRGLLRREHAKVVLLEILSWHPHMASLLTEVFSILELEVTTIERLSRQREQLLSLVKLINLDKLYCERLEIETLGDTGIVKHKKNFLTKQIKARTKLYYKQQKFNLLREESEGYSKLITELNQDLSDSVDSKLIIHVVRSLIGCFNLDPNRVLDLILEAFESRPEEYKFFTNLLLEFPHEPVTITEILRFRLQNYDETDQAQKSLLILMALLLRSDILSLENIYALLSPDDASMSKQHDMWMQEAQAFVRSTTVVSTKDKDENEAKADSHDQLFLQPKEPNQKIRFMVALLEIGSWDKFLTISKRFPSYFSVSWQPVAEALCELVQYLIEPMSKRYSDLPNRLCRSASMAAKPLIMMTPITTTDQLMDIVFPMITALGPHIHNNVKLFYRVLRISRVILKKETKVGGCHSREYYEFLTIVNDSLLPAVSMLESNPCVAEEVWETIKLLDYQHRYKLYSNWKNESYNQHPRLMVNRANIVKKVKQITKRVTKETIKPTSRHLGKISHNFPGPVLEYVLKQVQLYDNMIGPVVDSFKYLTSLSFDVLAFCMVEIFCSSTERTQEDGLAISRMVQSLSNFAGSVCKKYPFDLSGLLQFVANQLKCEKSIDLLLLKDIVQKMGGAEIINDPTPELLDAMSGGEILRKEAGQYLQEKNTKRSSMRLKDVLLENNLAMPLLLLMGQHRSCIAYKETETPHLKLVGKLYDQCQSTMVQYGNFISSVVTIAELTSKLPGVPELLSDYHIDTDVAFFLARPMTSHLLQMRYDELRRRDRAEKKLAVEEKKKIFADACAEIFAPIIDSIKPQFKPKVWEDIDAHFFFTFWMLSMTDLEVPTQAYDKEIQKLTEMPTSKTRKRDLERINALKDKLEDEKRKQLEHVDRVSSWFTKEKDAWFKSKTRSPKNDTIITFLQQCIFPRCKFTTLDAIYCARFIKLLHNMKTPNFSTLLCFDKLFCHITYTVTSCTEQETQHYARFLLEMLEMVKHWHSSKDVFEKECSKWPGFITRYRISTHEENDYVEYENFRHVVHKWHFKITKAMMTCLESGDYIQIRNAIYILQGILPCFPVISNLSSVIEKRIEKVISTEKNHRGDLHVLANSYSGRLKAKKPTLMFENEFHIKRKSKVPETIKHTNADPKEESKIKKESVVNGDDKNSRDLKTPKKEETTVKLTKTEKRSLDATPEAHPPRADRKKKKEDKSKDEKSKKKKELKKKLGESPADVSPPTSNGASKNSSPKDEVDSNRSSKRRKLETDVKASPKQEDSVEKKRRKTPHTSPEPPSPKEPKRERRDRKRTVSPTEAKHKAPRKSQRLH